MRRRRLPSRRGSDAPTALVRATRSSDFRYLEHVVALGYTLRSARVYLARHMANRISVRLVEARRGETVGVVRCVQVRHAETGQETMVRGQRRLADGRPASFFVPDHLVHVVAVVEGARKTR